MKLDSLTRLIEAADFMSFRELALECLKLKGYREIALTDGWRDGGTDVRVFQLPPNPTPLAFQITVEKNWRAKLHHDSTKVRDVLKLLNLVLVTSRRVAESEFQREAERVWQTLGVQATKLDGPAIAGAFYLECRTTRVLEILGIDVAQVGPVALRHGAREEAAYSFVFFGRDTDRFREATIESAAVALGARLEDGCDRFEFESELRDVLQIPAAQEARITSAIDRMLQRGDLLLRDNRLVLNAQLQEAARAMQLLRDKDWDNLRQRISSFIAEHSGSGRTPPESSLDAVLEALGAVLLKAAQETSASLGQSDQRSVLDEQMRVRLRRLHATLDSLGFAEGRARDVALESLAEMASNSPIGKCMLAGELFISLSTSKTPQLIRALGARSAVKVLLDSSVAIPMLCGLLYATTSNRFSVAAHHAYSQLLAHDLSIVLPLDYLEECAAHLLRAYSDYREVIEIDPDLVASENAFVAHYAGLRVGGSGITFSEYVRGFGLDDALHKADFYVARDNLQQRLERLFDRYSIEVRNLGRPSLTSQRRAEESIAYATRELKVERPDVLITHDIRTVGYLHDSDRKGDVAHVLCTWDGVQFYIREHEEAVWQVLNPAVLGDVLALASPNGLDEHIANPTVVAKALSEGAAERGAAVWDQLVRIESGAFFDAELLSQARAFKEDYIKRALPGSSQSINRAWAEWKVKYYTKLP